MELSTTSKSMFLDCKHLLKLILIINRRVNDGTNFILDGQLFKGNKLTLLDKDDKFRNIVPEAISMLLSVGICTELR